MALTVYTPTVIAIGIIYVVLLRRRRLRLAAACLLALVMAGLYGSVTLVDQFVNMFGLGIFVTCPATLLTLVVFIAGRARFFRRYPNDRVRQRLYIIGLVLVPLVLLGPWGSSRAISLGCDALNRDRALTIITAVRAYNQTNNAYPEDLTVLAPAYLDVLPVPACFGADLAQSAEHPYALVACRNGQVVLTVDAFSTDFIQRYELATDRWSTVSFLDGVCSFLS